MEKETNIKKSLSSPHLKRCGLCGTSGCRKFDNFLPRKSCKDFRCSEKDSFKETVCTLKGAVYFSDIKTLVAILVAALLILAVILTSLVFSLELVENLVLSWVTTTIYSVFLFFLFDNKLIQPVKIIERPIYIEKPVIKEVVKLVDNPIQIPVENRTIQVVERPVTVYRDIVRPLIQRMSIPKKKLNIPKFRYIGSKVAKRYHKRTCRLSKLIKKKFKIHNNSQKFFIKKHFKACKSCLKK